MRLPARVKVSGRAARALLVPAVLIVPLLTVPLLTAAQEDADSWNKRGLALKEEGRYDVAIEAFTRALKLDPGHLQAMNNLGRVYFVTGRYSEAADLFEKVLGRTPHAVGTMKNLAARGKRPSGRGGSSPACAGGSHAPPGA